MVRRLSAATILSLVFASIRAFGSPPALADGTCYGNFHYAQESVVLNGSGGWYHAPSCIPPEYYGWIGVDGQIAYPSQVPSLGSQNNHSAGWIGITFQNGSWVQEGWYYGCAGGQCRTSGTLGTYTEVNVTTAPFYQLIDWGPAPFSGSSIFLIEYAGSQCWNLFFDYSNLKEQYCGLPTAGVPSATSETYSSDGRAVGMPATLYGYSNPNTNNALRIKGGNGFVPWTTTLSSGETAYYDERNGQTGCGHVGNPDCAYYWLGWYNPNYYVYAVNT